MGSIATLDVRDAAVKSDLSCAGVMSDLRETLLNVRIVRWALKKNRDEAESNEG